MAQDITETEETPEGYDTPVYHGSYPSKDTPRVREEVLTKVAEGNTLHSVLKDPNRPGYWPSYEAFLSYVHDPMDRHLELRQQFIRAIQAYSQYHLDVAEEKLYDPDVGWMWSEKHQEWRPDSYSVTHLREVMSHSRWRVKTVIPVLYGDKMQVDVNKTETPSGPRIDWSKLSDSALKEVRNAMYNPDDPPEQSRIVSEGEG